MRDRQKSLANAIIHLKTADMYMADFYNSCDQQSHGRRVSSVYRQKIEWILNDLKTNTRLPDFVREWIKSEIEGDVLVIPALIEKISLLKEEGRQALEELVDCLLSGQELKIETINNETSDSKV